ncbi:SAGA complex component, partial [Aspergillus sp. HF37]
MVEASGFKFSEKDTKPGKVKVKKTGTGKGKKKNKADKDADSANSSPALPDLDDKTLAAFPTGRPREENSLETVMCKHCKKPTLKHVAIEHIQHCLQTKQERARKKKEARDAANRAKEKEKG